ncbi:MAG: hypothetical protein AABX89_08320 [Candidatus Thermoplasmatota archaeon]
MPFSKFEPNRPQTPEPEGTTPQATRRANLLRWGNLILFAMTVLGFGLMFYWMSRGN